MVAPLGPARADALTFTLLKPPAGAWTMTCVSTVSPRALERLMEAVVPGASVLPTLTRLGDTHAGNAAEFVTVRVAGLLVTVPAELLTVTLNCAPLSDIAVAGVV